MNHQAIRGALICRCAGATEAGAIAIAIISIWHEVASRLAPVIGGQGVDVLLRHALHVTGKHFPCMAVATNTDRTAELLADLQSRLVTSEATLAMAAGTALLVTFTELLVSLIGESLSERLLAPVWAPQLLASAQESVP
jgi:hypothetical protein